MKNTLLLAAATLVAANILAPCAGAADAVFTGASGTAWGTAGNWFGNALPAASGDNLTIADTTTNNLLLLGANRSIGALYFGNTPGSSRAPAFVVAGPNTLTFTGDASGYGLIANGNFQTAMTIGSGTGQGLLFRSAVTIANDQIWQIAGNNGTDAKDYGVTIGRSGSAAAGSGSTPNLLTLNGDLTKTGSGQLILCATTVTGAGNIIGSEGTLKLNAGEGSVANPTALTLAGGAGQGNITVNSGANLLVYANSGSLSLSRDIVLNGGSILQTGGGGTAGNDVNIQSNIALNGDVTVNTTASGKVATIAGTITGTGGFTKTGVGVLELSAANDYTGTTAVSAGTLRLGATGSITSTNIAVSGTGILDLGGKTLAVTTLAAGGGQILGNLTFDGTTITAGASTLALTGALTVTGVNTVNLSDAFTGARVSSGIYDILSYTGGITGTGTFALGTYTAPATVGDMREISYALLAPSATALQVQVTGGVANLLWRGTAGNNTWDVKTSANWERAGVPGIAEQFYEADTVTFDDTAAYKTVALSNTKTLTAGSVLVNNSAGTANDYTFTGTGTLGGAAAFLKEGTGTVNFNAATVTLEGGLRINAGTVNIINGSKVTTGTTTTTKTIYIGGIANTVADKAKIATVSVNNSELISTADLYVGFYGTGTLNITNGGKVTNTNCRIGTNTATETGTVNVSGKNADGTVSTWANSGYLYVGNTGTGTLNITNGGKVTSSNGYIGYSAGSTGTVNVFGANSTWTNSGGLYVGYNGTGTLNITNGGKVTNIAGYIGGYDAGSTGTVNVSGAGST